MFRTTRASASRRRAIWGLAPLLAAAVLAGCAGEQASLEALSAEPLATDVPEGTELVVADQNERLQTLMKVSGAHDQLAGETTYANFLGGPEILEAVRSGSVDLAIVGDTPPIQAHAAGDVVPIVAALGSTAPDYKFAVRPGLEVTTLEQLEGRRIAYAEGTGRQPFVLRALDRAGLTQDDVELVRLDVKDFPDAIRTGEVDVAPLNEPHFTRYLGEPGASALPPKQNEGLSNGLEYLYARGDALADDAKAGAIRDFVQRWVGAQQWAVENPEAWIDAYFVDMQDLSPEEGRSVVEAEGELYFPPLDDDLVELQQQTIDVIHRAGDLPERLDAAEEFDTRFDEAIAEAVEQAGARREQP